jgi:hypothetical protein
VKAVVTLAGEPPKGEPPKAAEGPVKTRVAFCYSLPLEHQYSWVLTGA